MRSLTIATVTWLLLPLVSGCCCCCSDPCAIEQRSYRNCLPADSTYESSYATETCSECEEDIGLPPDDLHAVPYSGYVQSYPPQRTRTTIRQGTRRRVIPAYPQYIAPTAPIYGAPIYDDGVIYEDMPSTTYSESVVPGSTLPSPYYSGEVYSEGEYVPAPESEWLPEGTVQGAPTPVTPADPRRTNSVPSPVPAIPPAPPSSVPMPMPGAPTPVPMPPNVQGPAMPTSPVPPPEPVTQMRYETRYVR